MSFSERQPVQGEAFEDQQPIHANIPLVVSESTSELRDPLRQHRQLVTKINPDEEPSSLTDAIIEKNYDALSDFDRRLAGEDTVEVKAAQSLGEQMFRTRLALRREEEAAKRARDAELFRQKQEAEERLAKERLGRENLQNLLIDTADILEIQMDNLRLALDMKRLQESQLPPEKVKKLREEAGIAPDEVYWEPQREPARYRRSDAGTEVIYTHHVPWERSGPSDPDSAEPKHYELTIAKVGEFLGSRAGEQVGIETPRLAIDIKDGKIQAVTLRGYSVPGTDERLFPQLFVDEDAFPRDDVPLNKLARALDEEARWGGAYDARQQTPYYWILGVDFRGETPRVFTKYGSKEFAGFRPDRNNAKGIILDILKPLPGKQYYDFDPENNKFVGVNGRSFTIDEYESILAMLFTIPPSDDPTENIQLFASLDAPYNPLERVELLSEHGMRFDKISTYLDERSREVFKHGIEALRRDVAGLQALGVESFADLPMHERSLYTTGGAKAVQAYREMAASRTFSSPIHVHVFSDRFSFQMLEADIRRHEYDGRIVRHNKNALTGEFGKVIPAKNGAMEYRVAFVSPVRAKDVKDPLDDEHTTALLGHQLRTFVDPSLRIGREKGIFRTVGVDNSGREMLEQVGAFPSFTYRPSRRGRYSFIENYEDNQPLKRDFSYQSQGELETSEELSAMLDEAGMIMRIYLSMLHQVNTGSIPDEAVSIMF